MLQTVANVILVFETEKCISEGFLKLFVVTQIKVLQTKKVIKAYVCKVTIQVTNLFRELLHTVIFDPLYLYRRDSCSALCIFKKSVGVSYMLLKQSSNIKKGCCANTKKNGNDAWLIIKFKHSFFNLVKIVNHFLLFLVSYLGDEFFPDIKF